MLFKDIIGLPHIKNHLTTTADRGRIPHAQLFVGKSGSGTLPMAIAYAQYLICKNENGENSVDSSCNLQFQKLAHPDVHFVFPVATSDKVKSHPVSSHYLQEWRKFVAENPYGSLFEWHQDLGIEKKQGQISVHEAQDILKSLSLKSFQGGFKVCIIWMADKMNISASNKLLKLIEEPPEKTIFLLITEDEEQIIQTIRSRCQVLRFPPLSENDIAEELQKKYNCDNTTARKIAHQSEGDYLKALHILNKDADDEQFEKWFVQWVRSAFQAKGKKSVVLELVSWSNELAALGRETQKSFLLYCMDFFRQAMLLNYQARELVYLEPATNFKLEKFAPFITGKNIVDITRSLEDAIYHIERNGNAKIIFTDLSIKLTRLLHKN